MREREILYCNTVFYREKRWWTGMHHCKGISIFARDAMRKKLG
jgi:hypothetical protein